MNQKVKATLTMDEMLQDRRATHGKFNDHAAYTQEIKAVIRRGVRDRLGNHPPLSDTQLESLEMIAHKIGRILAGDASFQDHWDDIAGYAKIANGVD